MIVVEVAWSVVGSGLTYFLKVTTSDFPDAGKGESLLCRLLPGGEAGQAGRYRAAGDRSPGRPSGGGGEFGAAEEQGVAGGELLKDAGDQVGAGVCCDGGED